MDQRRLSKSSVTRRELLAGAAAASLIATPIAGRAGSLSNLHREAARKAAALASGRDVRIRLLMPHGSEANINQVISTFRKLSGLEVETTVVPVDEINTELTLDALSGGDSYDLALPSTFGIPDLAATGAILRLTEFAQRHEPAEFRDEVLYPTGDSFDSEIYGFQADGAAYLMFYHRDWLEDEKNREEYEDAFGKELQIPNTWGELDRQMEFFHRPNEGRYGGALFRKTGYLAWEWWVRFHAKGIWPFSEDLEPQIDSDQGVEALEEMVRASDFLYPEARTTGLFENWRRYSEGDIYCNIGWGGSQKFLNGPESKMRGRMIYSPTPGGFVDGRLLIAPYFNWGWSYVVTANSLEAELAYLFALFASSPAISTLSIRARDGFFDPFRSEHYADSAIQEMYSPEFLLVHETSLKSALPDLYLANQSEYFLLLNERLERAIDGSETPRAALNRVAQQWRLLNDQSQIGPQIKRWKRLRSKYPESIRNRLKDIH